MLPWLDHVIAGTTDEPSDITPLPRPSEKEISFILENLSEHLQIQVGLLFQAHEQAGVDCLMDFASERVKASCPTCLLFPQVVRVSWPSGLLHLRCAAAEQCGATPAGGLSAAELN